MANGSKPGNGGKGAFRYEGAGTKCMSSSKGPLKSAQGKMSSAHGTTGQSKNNNMDHNTGGYRIGSGTRTFHHNGIKQHSGVKGDTQQASQPSGHKDKA